jgi:hypothetical protein
VPCGDRGQKILSKKTADSEHTSLDENALIVFVARHPAGINQALLPHTIGLFLRDVIAEAGCDLR